MNNFSKILFPLFICIALVSLLPGCGSSSSSKSSTSSGSLEPASAEYPNAGLLVSADSLQKNLRSKNLVIIDARSSGYATAHIPGAINLKFGDYFTAGTGLKSIADLQGMLGNSGLSRDMTMVIYDDTTASWGAAGRIFWMLEYLGCNDVHILDGGWDKWTADGRSTDAAVETRHPVTFTASANNSIRVNKSYILNRLQTENFAVVDSRTDEEYMGWQIYGEARGGHIPGAVNIPYAWFFNTDKTLLKYSDLKTMLESRGITSDKEVTAYCTAGIRSGFVYFALRLMGYSHISNYDASMYDWSADTSYPIEMAPNYSRVVYAGWVKDLADGKNPPTYSGNGYIIFECSWGPTSKAYNDGHIPGAIHFDTNNVEARDWTDPDNPAVTDANEIVWDLVKDTLLQTRLRNMGINDNTTVIVYGKSSTAATRVYWALRYAGKDVRFLNGGYEQWIASGGTKDTQAHYPAAVGNITLNPQNQIKALTPEILSYANYFRTNRSLQPGKVVVDVRTMDEYIGAVVGYNDPNITRKGRIPGAVWGYEASNKVYIDTDGTMRSYTEIRDLWNAQGITPDKTLIFYCGTGWRSTLSFLYADLMGYPNIKNYDSWYVWSTFYELSTGTIHYDASFNDPNMPIDTGWPGP
jgi:3-mercaptopyruvate sulfurtransferase SseA